MYIYICIYVHNLRGAQNEGLLHVLRFGPLGGAGVAAVATPLGRFLGPGFGWEAHATCLLACGSRAGLGWLPWGPGGSPGGPRGPPGGPWGPWWLPGGFCFWAFLGERGQPTAFIAFWEGFGHPWCPTPSFPGGFRPALFYNPWLG